MRFEQKFVVTQRNIERKMRLLFSKDFFYPDNFIFNVYFDTFNLKSLYEKLDGNLQRNKLRLRWYQDNSEFISPKYLKLENKIKRNNHSYKINKEIQINESLNNSDFLSENFVKKYIFPHLIDVKFYAKPFPVFLSSYFRLRFNDLLNNARLNIDKDIKIIQLSNFAKSKGLKKIKLNETVVEYKEKNGQVSDTFKKLGKMQLGSFSKYSRLLIDKH